ncbi:MAG TPA: prepilin peptidase [Micromonosporaceae bacterium]|nr:prepilin peptidase [Micromonosporaceae bacterium]
MSVALAAAGAAVGAAVGAVTPRIAYRLSVPYGSPPRMGCQHCARPFTPGLPGWIRPTVGCPGCPHRLGPRRWHCLLAGTGSFALLCWTLGTSRALPAYLVVAGFGLVLAFVDLACLRLPDPLVAAAFLAGGSGLALAATVEGAWDDLGRAALGALVSAGAYLVLALLPGANLGFGDVKLAGVLGLLLGWLGWPAVLLGLALPHLINGPVALGLLLARRAGRRTELPLGPALLAGALLAVVLSAGG